jgi:MATE family, multidrug efflux pump
VSEEQSSRCDPSFSSSLLGGPILPDVLRLAAPNVLNVVGVLTILVVDAFCFGRLGSDALAGGSLVFPISMLMQTLAAGSVGGAVASTIARALGTGDPVRARALAIHAVLIAIGVGALFTVALGLGGPTLYEAMGARGATLEAASRYSGALFAGAIVFWLFHLLASAIRGTGQMVRPAVITVAAVLAYAFLAPILMFGIGSAPGLGPAGAGVALVAAYALGLVALVAHLLSSRTTVRLAWRDVRFARSIFGEILRLGFIASLNSVMISLTVVVTATLVAPLGTASLAGWGLASRLDFLVIPLAFSIGTALVTLVGANVGAGQLRRAYQIAWTGAVVAALVTGSLGVIASLVPDVWLGWFTSDPETLAAGATYLRVVGPAYGAFGVGLALHFASLGAGRIVWPIIASAARLAFVIVAGSLIGRSLFALCVVLAAAFVLYGTTIFVAIKLGAWRGGGTLSNGQSSALSAASKSASSANRVE